MVKKGDKFLYNGPSFSIPVHDPRYTVERFDLVIVEKNDGPYVSAYVSKVGISPLFLADPLDLIPYEEFPEDDPVDTRSIAFWNKISRNRLVFYKIGRAHV